MYRAIVALSATAFLVACGGTLQAAAPSVLAPGAIGAKQRPQASLALRIPPRRRGGHAKRPGFVSPGTQSVRVVVNDGKPQIFDTVPSSDYCSGTQGGGLTCRFVVYVDSGLNRIVVETFDRTGGAGAMLDAGKVAVTITPGQPVGITLKGVPARIGVSGVPPATAGSAFASPQTFDVTVRDANGNVIVGAYATPVRVSDNESGGATAIVTSGSDNPPAGELLSSDDAAAIAYTGLAIGPVTIEATANGATSGSAIFAPSLKTAKLAAVCAQGSDACANSSASHPASVQFTAQGDAATLTPSETGYTNAPYSRTFRLAGDTCNTADDPQAGGDWATLAPAPGNAAASFTAIAQNAGTPGNKATCAATFVDGAGQTISVNIEVTVSSGGIH